MASIPKVFNQRKKTQSEIESEQFEKNQYNHIGKAINSVEGAPKEKHVRVIILGTFHYSGASIFYKHTNLHNLQSNPIACWKFLYVVHKIMRDGHEQALKDVIKNERYIRELRDLWGHMKSGYGTIIASFCTLLCHKIKFHKLHRQFPGNLVLNNEDALTVGKTNDEIFELSLDILNYLEVLVQFEQTVINSLDKSKSNSMTPQGQCRLTPLIQVIQDLATFYDLTVRLLFKLHSKLDVDLLSGHRQRFTKLFQLIKAFFQQAQTFQYFKTLIQVPTLPENPPNFFVESDLVAQKALVVNVNEEDDLENNLESPPEKVDSLIEFDKPNENSKFDSLFGQMGAFDFGDSERTQMQNEIDYLKNLIEKIKAEYSERVNSLLARIRVLEEEVKGLVQLKDQYEEKIRHYENHKCDTIGADKFNKIKDAYTKLREEHVKVLRQQGECKQELEKKKQEIQNMEIKIQDQERAYAELEKKNLIFSSNEKNMDQCKEELVEAQSQLKICERSKFEYMAKAKNLEAKNKELEKELQTLRSEIEQTKETDKHSIFKLETELQALRQNIEELTSKNHSLNQKSTLLENQLEFEKSQNKKMMFLHDNLIKSSCEYSEALIETTYRDLISNSSFYDSCRISNDALSSAISYVVKELGLINVNISQDQSPEVKMKLSNSIHQFGHFISECLIDGKMMSNDADELTQEVQKNLSDIHTQSLSLLKSISNNEDNLHWSNKLKDTLQLLLKLSKSIEQKRIEMQNETSEDLFEEELRNTKNAIDLAEERFKMILEESRSRFSGLQLEVNEKILDSCSELMYAIKILIERSKSMQAEIVKQGKGSGSVKDFYKKHHKWTEGLISAAKAVGAGAVWLCEAADNLITKDGKFEELIVCAREITASTAQLVVSSRVKAEPTSPNLSNLFEASKNVSSATGKVIANAKNAVTVLAEKGSYDFSNLSLTQARRLEMDSQVKVLELESDLEKERKRLGEIRKKHYQLAGEVVDDDFISSLEQIEGVGYF